MSARMSTLYIQTHTQSSLNNAIKNTHICDIVYTLSAKYTESLL